MLGALQEGRRYHLAADKILFGLFAPLDLIPRAWQTALGLFGLGLKVWPWAPRIF